MRVFPAAVLATQFGNLAAAAPFENRALKTIFAVGAPVLPGFSFLVVAIFIESTGPFSGKRRTESGQADTQKPPSPARLLPSMRFSGTENQIASDSFFDIL